MKLFVAATFADRLGGLLTRKRLTGRQGLLLLRCAAVHSAFMSYPLALVFFGTGGQVIGRVKYFPPWRVAWYPGAIAVLEISTQCTPAAQWQLEWRAARVLRAVR